MRLLESIVAPYRPLDLTPYTARREACIQAEVVQSNCARCSNACYELCRMHGCDGHGVCAEVLCLCTCMNL